MAIGFAIEGSLTSQLIRAGLKAAAMSRSAVFTGEGLMLPIVDFVVNRRRPRLPSDDPQLFIEARKALHALLDEDIARIARGVYPIEVVRPESPIKHIKRIPILVREGLKAAVRKKSRKSQVFGDEAQDLLSDLPEYYRRNFHFQADGYLSDLSAEIYEHQVEVLFAGAADAMRRLIIEPIKKHIQSQYPDNPSMHGDGEGLHFLELGAGTGRSTLFMRLAFPKAKITAIDLSGPYLKRAQKSLRSFQRHDFFEASAEQLPFSASQYDVVYSVFLFHELPLDVRKSVIKEASRVLKPGGFFGFVDSLQRGDIPGFDRALERFPIDFHEPFYRNYIDTPMSSLIEEQGLEVSEVGTGFFSKWMAAKK